MQKEEVRRREIQMEETFHFFIHPSAFCLG